MSAEQEPHTMANEAPVEVKPTPQEYEQEGPSNVPTQEQETTTPSSPKQGSALLANLPHFLKKPFEKKHEEHATTEPADTTVTETSDEAAAQPDKSEKRLSRTLMDLIHKKTNRPDQPTESAPVSPEGHETTEQNPHPSSKEPIMDHLRKLFTKKPADAPAEDTNALTSDDTNVTENEDHPTVPTDLPSEEARPTSLSRRFSKLAQNLTSRIKETNKKPKVDEPIEESVNADNNAPEEPHLPDSVSNHVLPVPASA